MPSQEHYGCFPYLKNGIDQLCLIVEDLDKAVESYWKLFGIGPWRIYTYGKPLLKRMRYRGEPGDYKMRLALAQMGPLQIELIEPLEGDSVYADFVRKHGYGLHHIAVPVEDMEAAIAQAEAAGLTVAQYGEGYGRDGDGSFAYLDSEAQVGTTIELLQRPRRKREPDRVYPPAGTA
jgi:4-hydroxyphenylpyruvate dioxygenase-like putative hemolysin